MSRFLRPFLPDVAMVLVGLAAAIVWILTGCSSSQDPGQKAVCLPPWFEDVTDRLKLDFKHEAGPTDGDYFMPQICGSGAALFDFDGDGKLDIYLVQNAGPKSAAKNRLFHQEADGTFKDVSAGSGLDFTGYCMAAIVADVNNDGLPDLFVTEFGGSGGRMFLNKGNGRFEQVKNCGIDNPLWSTAASFLDYNADGWLDLVIVNYVDLSNAQPCVLSHGGRDYCAPSNYKSQISRLYRNRGVDANGNWLGFEDQTEKSRLNTKPGPGLGILCADFNGDGWPDIFIANDGKANHLWINQKNGTFTEEASQRGIAFNKLSEPQANMGIAYGDVSGSGMNDVLVTHLDQEYHCLWKQGPRGMFSDEADEAGLTRAKWRGTGWGSVLADFNHDGALDLAIVNGRVYRANKEANDFWLAYSDRNQLFLNDGTGKFSDISLDNPALCATPNPARGLAVGDIDGDGALDLLVTQIGGRARLFRNIVPNRGHWLMVRAFDPKRKRDAIGAEVHLQAGQRHLQRLVQTSLSYLCSHDPRVHFGLGQIDRVDSIEVLWPGNVRERFRCPGVDRLIELRRGEGEIVTAPKE